MWADLADPPTAAFATIITSPADKVKLWESTYFGTPCHTAVRSATLQSTKSGKKRRKAVEGDESTLPPLEFVDPSAFSVPGAYIPDPCAFKPGKDDTLDGDDTVLKLSAVETLFLQMTGVIRVCVTSAVSVAPPEAIPASLLLPRLRLTTTDFPVLFAAYCHYRRKGWIVRHAGAYGFDFVLYSKGPGQSHAEFGVVVVTQPDESRPPVIPAARLSALSRACESVCKSLMVCIVMSVTPPVCEAVTSSTSTGSLVSSTEAYDPLSPPTPMVPAQASAAEGSSGTCPIESLVAGFRVATVKVDRWKLK